MFIPSRCSENIASQYNSDRPSWRTPVACRVHTHVNASSSRRFPPPIIRGLLLFLFSPLALHALSPQKSLTQYTRTVWTQEHGLPQDTIRAITQTTDGYIWLGTDEGLARFDGYEFKVFDKNRGQLPGNSITTLAPGLSGDLWIGTSAGLVHYQNNQFRVYTKQQGLPENAVTQLITDPDGSLWIVSAIYLSHFQAEKFTTFSAQSVAPVSAVRSMYLDRSHTLWIAGYGGVAKRESGKFVPVLTAGQLDNDIIIGLLRDRDNNLWLAGTKGLAALSPDGKIRKYSLRDGLPDAFVRSLWQDRDGNLWAGTNGGLARMENGRFVSPAIDPNPERDWVRCIFEDREGNLWVGMNSGLNRFRDDIFTIYSKSEGLPSDEPTTVYQDHTGHVWVGFHDAGLVRFSGSNKGFETYSTANGLPSNEVFSIRETASGDLLLATREGFTRMHNGRFTNVVPDDPLGRRLVFDALEDHDGRIWIADSSGLSELRNGRTVPVLAGGPLLNSAVVVLSEGLPSHLWAGTSGNGLWHLHDGTTRHFTTADGLSSDQIRCLYPAGDGTVWIGTFGGGLNRLRDGHFLRYTSKDGLLSDNIAHIEDDHRGYLWLSTTRGICRISKQQLADFSAGKIKTLTPTNYGVADGLRSAQCAPGAPIGGAGRLTRDAHLWVPTSRGLAVLDLNRPASQFHPPLIHLIEATSKGVPVDLTRPTALAPDSNNIQMRYAAIHLSSPERVRYSYKLEGLDANWVSAGSRRTIHYNSLPHGPYRFLVRAEIPGPEIPGGQATEAAYSFSVLPHFYETLSFRLFVVLLIIAAAWWAYQLRLRQIRSRFALVLEERVRLAREIHDTLAQGFVGISAQLDAVAMCIPHDPSAAQGILDLARRMARHSLTEARRAVMGLRASALDGQDLATALRLGTTQWTAGYNLEVQVDADPARLPQEMEQNLLRIAQEAVTNTLKHSGAGKVWIRLRVEARKLYLRINDDGRGFADSEVFSGTGGHFGLIGMRERAERLGGELRLESEPGNGTLVEVMVPLP
jgi:ligand-binding sensor domain-containing protein/anti-sigma regulatory factor (Ser/Thr protein kinase)